MERRETMFPLRGAPSFSYLLFIHLGKGAIWHVVTGAANIANYNPLRYRGYCYDSETGLHYLKSRYYDPQVKMFLNGDTVVAVNDKINSNNVFTYCFNNPLVFDDQSGCYVGWDDAAAILAGGAVSVLTQISFLDLYGQIIFYCYVKHSQDTRYLL